MGKFPKNHFQSTRLPSSPIKRKLLLKYIVELKEKGAILEVPSDQKGKGFYSPLFLVKKKTGDSRPVLDLKNLNRNIKIEAFKMESLQSILLAVNLGDWMLSVDLSDAYLHIPIHPAFQNSSDLPSTKATSNSSAFLSAFRRLPGHSPRSSYPWLHSSGKRVCESTIIWTTSCSWQKIKEPCYVIRESYSRLSRTSVG